MTPIASASSVPPHIHPPIAHVPSAMRETLNGAARYSIPALFGLISEIMVSCPSLARRSRDMSTSIDVARKTDLQSGFLSRDQPKRAPVEIGMAASDSRDEPVSHHVDRRHWGAGVFRLGERQAHILQHEGHRESGRVGLPDNPVAID